MERECSTIKIVVIMKDNGKTAFLMAQADSSTTMALFIKVALNKE